MKKLLIILSLILNLQGCIFVAGAAAGAAGVAVVYDHRKLEKIIEDQKITNSIVNKIKFDRELGAPTTHVDVTTFNHVVLLTGQTITQSLRDQIDQIAKSTPKVSRVYNEIAIKGPSSSLTRTSDSWITAKIKTQMMATKGLKSGTIKVVTENGSVYLMGIVTQEQADMAVEIARKVAGVQKVIKIFQYR